MTTLDGIERSFDADAVLVCDRDGPTGIAGIMGGLVSEVSESTTRVLLEVATWNGVNILRTSRKLGLRSDASNRNEKQLHPELALRAQRIASRLLVELCGARLVPGTIDVAGEIPDPRRVRLRGGRAERLLGLAIPFADQVDLPAAARVRGRARRRRPRGDGSVSPPLRRHPGGRPDRGGGADPRLRRAPAGDPARGDGAGRATERASSACAAAPRISPATSASTGSSPSASPTPASPGGCGSATTTRARRRSGSPTRSRASTRCCARRCSAGCSTSPATTSPTARAGSPSTSPGAPICARASRSARAPSAASFAGLRPAPAFEPWRLACLASGPLPGAGWRGEAAEPDFYALKGALEGSPPGSAARSRSSPAGSRS